MILDNLSVVGLFIASLYLLLPLLFGRELWRVDEAAGIGVTEFALAEAGSEGAWDSARESGACTES
jgi:hypothetical protein